MPGMRCFISYNIADKTQARAIGANLVLVGADVWFDAWKISAGDSIPGKLDEGLESFDCFLLLWSASAEKSNWVRKELSAAITRSVEKRTAKTIPCILDSTPLPPLIADLKRVVFDEGKPGMEELIHEVVGLRTREARLLAIQEALRSLDVNWTTHPATNVYICCPNCGAEDSFEPWQAVDHRLDAQYEGLRCTRCKWVMFEALIKSASVIVSRLRQPTPKLRVVAIQGQKAIHHISRWFRELLDRRFFHQLLISHVQRLGNPSILEVVKAADEVGGNRFARIVNSSPFTPNLFNENGRSDENKPREQCVKTFVELRLWQLANGVQQGLIDDGVRAHFSDPRLNPTDQKVNHVQ